jgi:hypothetical protein
MGSGRKVGGMNSPEPLSFFWGFFGKACGAGAPGCRGRIRVKAAEIIQIFKARCSVAP